MPLFEPQAFFGINQLTKSEFVMRFHSDIANEIELWIFDKESITHYRNFLFTDY